MSRVDHLLNQSVVTVRRDPGPPDRYNQPTMIETRATIGAFVRQIRTDDESGVGVIVTETIEVYFPVTTTVDDLYAIEYDDEHYEVVGRPNRPWNPRLQVSEYVSVLARRVGL